MSAQRLFMRFISMSLVLASFSVESSNDPWPLALMPYLDSFLRFIVPEERHCVENSMPAQDSRGSLNPDQACLALTDLLRGLAKTDEAASSDGATKGGANATHNTHEGANEAVDEDDEHQIQRSRVCSPAPRSKITSPLRQVTFASESLDDVFSEFERDDEKAKRGSRHTLSFRSVARYRRKSEHVAGKAIASRIFRADLSLAQWRPSVAAKQDHVFNHSDHHAVIASASEDEVSSVRSRTRNAPRPKRGSRSNVHLPLRVSTLGLSSLPLHESALANDFAFLADERNTALRIKRPLSIATIRERRMARSVRKAPLLPPIDITPFGFDFAFPSTSSDSERGGDGVPARNDDAEETGSVFFYDSGSWIPRSRYGSTRRPPPFGLPLSPRLPRSESGSFSSCGQRVATSLGDVHGAMASAPILSAQSSPASASTASATRRHVEGSEQGAQNDADISAVIFSRQRLSSPDVDAGYQHADPLDDGGLAEVSFSSDFTPGIHESITPISMWRAKDVGSGGRIQDGADSNLSSPLARSRNGSVASLAGRASAKTEDIDDHSRHALSFVPDWTFPKATSSELNYEIVSGAAGSGGRDFDNSRTTPRIPSMRHKSIVQASRDQRVNSALWFGQSREYCDNGVLATEEGLFVQSNRWLQHHDQPMQAESIFDTPTDPHAWQHFAGAPAALEIVQDERPTASWSRGDDGALLYRFTASAPHSIYPEGVDIADEIASQETRSLDDRILRDILDEIREHRSDKVLKFTKSEFSIDARQTSSPPAMAHGSAGDTSFAYHAFDHYRRSLDRRVLELLEQDHSHSDAADRSGATDRESLESEGDLKSKFTIPGKYNHPSYLRLNGLQHQPPPARNMS